MEAIAALTGAVVGAVVSFALTYFFTGWSERRKALTALVAELRLNRELALKILKTNSGINFRANNGSEWSWCQIIPFSASAWDMFVTRGLLAKCTRPRMEAISRAYSVLASANFHAVKVQMGKYNPRDGEEYTSRVTEAKNELERALESLDTSLD